MTVSAVSMAEKTADSFGVQLAKLLWPKLKKNCCQVTRLQYAAFPFSNFLFMRSFNLPHTLVAKSSKTQNSPCRLFERSYLSKSFGIVLRSLVHPIDFGAPRDGGNCSLPCRHVLHGVASGLQEMYGRHEVPQSMLYLCFQRHFDLLHSQGNSVWW